MSYEDYAARERECQRKAVELVGDQHPAYNIAPVIDLVRNADTLGFDVVRRNAEQQTCVHPFNRLGIDADGVMWCVECLTKPLVIPVPFGSPVNQGEPPR